MRVNRQNNGLLLRGVTAWLLCATTATRTLGLVTPPFKKVETGACQRAVLEGEAKSGETFTRAIGGGLEVKLESLSWGSGWLLRVLPVSGPRPSHDYAELSTPPYASVSPLLLSTDFSFRAQDAVAWNPRHFRFAANAKEYGQILAVYDRYSRSTPPAAGTENELALVVSKAPEGTFEILDATLIPGTADQGQMARMVASHFSTTAHTVEEPRTGKGMPLGKLTWVRFRVLLELPGEFKIGPGIEVVRHKCP